MTKETKMVSRHRLRRKIRSLKSRRVYKSPKTRKVRKQNVKSVRRQRSRIPYRRLKSTSRSPRFNNFRPQFLIQAPQVQPESLIQGPKAQLPPPSPGAGGRPLVPAINAPGPQCGSVICKKREKCIEGICTKTRLNVNFPNDLEEIRFIDKVNGGST